MRAIPIPLRGSSFQVADPTGLRNEAASILRDKKQQQVEARKALSMAVVMGRAEAPSGVINTRPVDEDPIPRNAEPLEPCADTRNSAPEEGSRHEELLVLHEDARSRAPVGDSHSDAALQSPHSNTLFDRAADSGAPHEHCDEALCVESNPNRPVPQHSNIVEPSPHSHFPLGHPVFLQQSVGTSSQAQASTTTAVPTTL